MGFYLNGCGCNERVEREVNYEGDVAATVGWGFDGVKIDSCGAQTNMTNYNRLFHRTGRAIVVENCHQGRNIPDGGNPGQMGKGWCPYNLFRTSGDIVNLWDRVVSSRMHAFTPFLGSSKEPEPLSRPGCWAYPDMLEVGRMPEHNAAESRSHFSSWAIVSSPLTLGFDLTDGIKFAAAWPVISNREVIEISQTWRSEARVLNMHVWALSASNGLLSLSALPTPRNAPKLAGCALRVPTILDGLGVEALGAVGLMEHYRLGCATTVGSVDLENLSQLWTLHPNALLTINGADINQKITIDFGDLLGMAMWKVRDVWKALDLGVHTLLSECCEAVELRSAHVSTSQIEAHMAISDPSTTELSDELTAGSKDTADGNAPSRSTSFVASISASRAGIRRLDAPRKVLCVDQLPTTSEIMVYHTRCCEEALLGSIDLSMGHKLYDVVQMVRDELDVAFTSLYRGTDGDSLLVPLHVRQKDKLAISLADALLYA
ncbi:MAG: hypothetical protein SGPRY_001869 [Prymnesium sp.]